MLLKDFRPRSKLVVKATPIVKPKFAVVDAHNHLSNMFGGNWEQRSITELLDRLDEAGVVLYLDLDGGWGEDILQHHLDAFKAKAPHRYGVFGGVDWSAWPEKGDAFPEWAAGRLRVQAGWVISSRDARISTSILVLVLVSWAASHTLPGGSS